VSSEAPGPPAPPVPLRPAAAVAAAAVLTFVAFPSSIAEILRLAAGASPRALSGGALVFAGVWAWLALRTSGAPRHLPGPREIAIAFGLLAVAALVQWIAPRGPMGGTIGGPGRARLDLLMIPVFAGALAMLGGGRAWLRRVAGPVALLVLTWPPAAALVAAPLSRPMLAASRWAGVGLARAFGVGVEAVPGVAGLLICRGAAGTQSIAVAPACSGASGVLAVLVAAAPVVALAGGSARRKAIWVASGGAIVAAFAPVRIAILCHLAAERGAESAFGAFHVLGGTAFFALAWVAMLALTRPLGLVPPPLAELPESRWRPAGREGWAVLGGALALAAAAGVGNVRMHASTHARMGTRAQSGPGIVVHDEPAAPFVSLDTDLAEPERARPLEETPVPVREERPVSKEQEPEPGPPPGPEPFNPKRLRTWIEPVPGYERFRYRSMPWTRSMYGKRSWMERIIYSSRDGELYWIDALIVSNPAPLEEHTVHGCYMWHGWTVEFLDRREVAPGVPGERFIHLDSDGRRWTSVTWSEKVAPKWWFRVNVQRKVREGEVPEAVLEEASDFAPRLRRRADAEVEGPF
jgi:exosortase/archaeosortase family protein